MKVAEGGRCAEVLRTCISALLHDDALCVRRVASRLRCLACSGRLVALLQQRLPLNNTRGLLVLVVLRIDVVGTFGGGRGGRFEKAELSAEGP